MFTAASTARFILPARAQNEFCSMNRAVEITMKNIRWNACLFICSLLLLTSTCAPQPGTASPLTGTLSELSGRVESKQVEETYLLNISGRDQTSEVSETSEVSAAPTF
jgi:hypothetical protein